MPVRAVNTSQRVVIAGGNGFIGTALAAEFSARGFDVVVLTRLARQRTDGIRELAWDGEHLGEWIQCLDGAAAVINLAGRNINCPHTPENLRAIASSRINSVQTLAAAVDHVKIPPRVWVQASAVGYYGDTREKPCDEFAPNGEDVIAHICHDWEAVFAAATVPNIRKVILRMGVVLGRGGGAVPLLAKLTRLYLGGAAGNGKQYISWIHLTDLVRIFVASVENEKAAGFYNAVAPVAVTNAEFMRELRRVLRRPWSPPVPVFAVNLGAQLMGSDPSLALMSQRCDPRRFREAGFRYQFPELTPALRDVCAKT
jgi:uncharacterized protein (TIGR01777 family)